MTSSIYPLPATLANQPIIIGNDILTSDITITRDQVRPGGGGILRLYFAFQLGGDTMIKVVNNGTEKGILNADNSFLVKNQGYYRFDIDVEEGDNINLISTVQIETGTGNFVNFFRAHFVRFGA